MKKTRAEAIVLRTHDLGESDQIVVLYSLEKGKLSGVARGAKKSMKRFGGCLEPLSHVRVQLAEIEGRDLHRIEGMELVASSFNVMREPEGLLTFSYIAELCDTFAQPDDPCPPLFRLIKHTLEHGTNTPLRLIARYFELWLLRLEGVLPDINVCGECGRSLSLQGLHLSVSGDRIGCPDCLRAVPEGWVKVSAEGVNQLKSMLERPINSMLDYETFDRCASELERMLRVLIRVNAGKPLKSLRFLSTLSHGAGRKRDPS